MGTTSKSFALILILIIALSSLIIVGTEPFGLAQNGTTINSIIINSDTTWTKASSPYTITGTVTVKNGATLTIESGATVSIPQSASLQIEGTLIAKGTPADSIVFNGGGDLKFMAGSTSWNKQTSTGSIIENAVINYVTTTILSSPKINNNTVYSGFIYLDGGSPQITSNSIACSIMSNNSVQSPVISNNNIVGSIIIYGGAPIISQNLMRGISLDGQSTCSAIVLLGAIVPTNLSNAVITDNTILCGLDGISSLADGVIIKNNLITNCSRDALALGTPPETTLYARVENNTFANSTIGINLFNYNGGEPSPVITQNNIQNNSQANVYSYCTINIAATHNWWGTTDEPTIKQSIHDHAFDSALGVINVMPCLTEANPFAYPNLNNQIPNPITTVPTNGNLTASPQPSPTSPNSTASTSPTATPTPTTVPAASFNGSKVDLVISGNITSSQMSNVTMATNQSANTTALSFDVTGESGTTGFGNITIPMNTIPYGTVPTIYIDGQQASNQGYTQDSNNYYVWYTTHFSTHQISIVFTVTPNNTPPPSPTSLTSLGHTSSQSSLIQIIYGLAAAAVIVAIVVVLLNLMIKEKKHKT